MIEYEQVDHTMLAMMEIYRRQVTDLKESLYHSEEARQHAEDDYEPERKRADELRGWLRESKAREQSLQATVTEKDAKITKLEGIIESLKIELQDARAAATAAKEEGGH
jgi:septal ring factor EnvC (AmiA/AmiB activator)